MKQRAVITGDVLFTPDLAADYAEVVPAAKFHSLMKDPQFARDAPQLFRAGKFSLIIDLVPEPAV